MSGRPKSSMAVFFPDRVEQYRDRDRDRDHDRGHERDREYSRDHNDHREPGFGPDRDYDRNRERKREPERVNSWTSQGRDRDYRDKDRDYRDFDRNLNIEDTRNHNQRSAYSADLSDELRHRDSYNNRHHGYRESSRESSRDYGRQSSSYYSNHDSDFRRDSSSHLQHRSHRDRTNSPSINGYNKDRHSDVSYHSSANPVHTSRSTSSSHNVDGNPKISNSYSNPYKKYPENSKYYNQKQKEKQQTSVSESRVETSSSASGSPTISRPVPSTTSSAVSSPTTSSQNTTPSTITTASASPVSEKANGFAGTHNIINTNINGNSDGLAEEQTSTITALVLPPSTPPAPPHPPTAPPPQTESRQPPPPPPPTSSQPFVPRELPKSLIPKYSDTSTTFAKRKEYKIVYDPDINKDKSKGKHPIYKYRGEKKMEDRTTVLDPRKREKYSKYASLGKKSPFNSLPVPRFTYDENWISKPPPTQILISGLSTLTSKSSVASQFKIFGEIESCELILNPDTAASLGLCHLRFKGSIDKAHRIAERAVNESKAVKIDLRTIKVNFDDDGSKAASIVNKVVTAKRKAEEEEAKKVAALKESSKTAHKGANVKQINARLIKSNSRSSTPTLKPILSTGSASASSGLVPPLPGSTLSSFPLIKPAIMKIIDRRPYIMICHKYLPTDDVYPSDIKRVLRDYDWVRVLCDDHGFYIIFDNPKEARVCHEKMDGKKLFEFRMAMDLYLEGFAPRVKGATALSSYHGTVDPSNKPSSEKESQDKVKIATERIIKDLRDLLWKDVKERIVAPRIFESLDPGRFEHIKKEAVHPAINTFAISETTNPSSDLLASVDRISFGKLPSLPRFKKKISSADSTLDRSPIKKFRKNARPMNHRLNFDESDDEKDSEASTRKASPIAESTTPSSEPEFIPKKKQVRLVRKREVEFSSSEDEYEKENEVEVKVVPEVEFKDEQPPEKKVKISKKMAVKAAPVPGRKRGRPRKVVEVEAEVEVDKEQVSDIDAMDVEDLEQELGPKSPIGGGLNDFYLSNGVDWDPIESLFPLSVCGDEEIADQLDLIDLQSVVKDDEDLELLREILLETEPDQLISNPGYWAWKNRQIKKLEIESRDITVSKNDAPIEMLIGKWDVDSMISRRSVGYYEINETDKAEYLQHRRKISKPIDTLQRYDRDSSLPGTTGSSRMNRVNNRRLAADINIQKQMLSSETDILNFNQLKKRKKAVKFARSAIHNWGLYAIEPIAANEMIIEYVGEVIRQQLADLRERNYIQSGIGSSYLFRIDETTVVDATKKGGIARVSTRKFGITSLTDFTNTNSLLIIAVLPVVQLKSLKLKDKKESLFMHYVI